MDPQPFLPLQEPTFYILLCLRGGERHGYAILKEVAELSGGRVTLSTGTLYGALNRLLEQGLISRADPQVRADPQDRGDPQGQTGARGKKVYHLTLRGLEVFEAELSRMGRLLSAAQVYQEGGAKA